MKSNHFKLNLETEIKSQPQLKSQLISRSLFDLLRIRKIAAQFQGVVSSQYVMITQCKSPQSQRGQKAE